MDDFFFKVLLKLIELNSDFWFKLGLSPFTPVFLGCLLLLTLATMALFYSKPLKYFKIILYVFFCIPLIILAYSYLVIFPSDIKRISFMKTLDKIKPGMSLVDAEKIMQNYIKRNRYQPTQNPENFSFFYSVPNSKYDGDSGEIKFENNQVVSTDFMAD